MLWEWRHQVRLTPPEPGKFLTCCLGAAAIVWGKSCMAQSPAMLWSEPLSSSSPLGKTDSTGIQPGKQHGLPPGLAGACLGSSEALAWIAISFESLPFTFWQGLIPAANKPYSARGPQPAPARSRCPVGLRVPRGAAPVPPSQGPWGTLGGPELEQWVLQGRAARRGQGCSWA